MTVQDKFCENPNFDCKNIISIPRTIVVDHPEKIVVDHPEKIVFDH